MTTAQLSPEDAMYGYGFHPKKVWRDSLRYILLTILSIIFKTPWTKVNLVYQRIHEFLLEVDETPEQLKRDMVGLDAGWPRMRGMLRNNRGMTKLMLDHGCRSKIIYPYILAGSQAVSLEVFNGKAFDLAGDFVDIPYSDRAIIYAIWEAIGVDIRERIKFEQDQIQEMDWRLDEDVESWEMLTCGAGLCSFLRMYDFAMPKRCRIKAIDMDKRNLKNLNLVFDDVRLNARGCSLDEHNVSYEITDIETECNRSQNKKRFKIVNAQGVASYYRFGGKTKRLIADLLKAVSDDGVLLLDLQVFEISLLRCALCMGWISDLFPEWTVKSAIKRMRKICDALELEMEYRICSRNPCPTTILFMLRRQ